MRPQRSRPRKLEDKRVLEPGIKLTTYFEERDRVGDRFLADALFDVYERHAMHTSVLLRGVAGFGEHHHLHTDRLLTLSENLPAVSIAVDTRERIEQALPDVLRITTSGLVTVERARLAGDDLEHVQLAEPPGTVVKLTLFGGRAVRADGKAGYVAAVEALREAGVSGATVLLAVDGTLHGQRRRARFLARNAGVPLMLLAVGEARSIESALPTLAGLLEEPVATIERIRLCKSEGVHLSEPHDAPQHDPAGLAIWQKIVVHAEEQDRSNGRPLYAELVRRLHVNGAAGVTVLRGVRGFYGEREPIADGLFGVRRNVPVHAVIVDTPEKIRRMWPMIDAVTFEHGVVTSELVPATHAVGDGEPSKTISLATLPGT
jgi:PII-like signaling protein